MSSPEDEKTMESVKFFIFDTSREYSEEEEYKSIIYFYPPETSRDSQMKEVGKTAAIIKFSQTFGADNATHTLHTKKTRHYIYIPEPGFCMAMTISLKLLDQDQPIDLSDRVYHSLLMHSYSMFCLFMGTLKSAVILSIEPNIDELEQLKLRAAYFFPKHVQLMPLQDADLADAFLGVQFLPLDKLSFLRVRSLVNHIEQTFPWVSYTTVLYKEQIVWSGLNPKDVQLVYNYLTTKLIPASSNTDSRFLTGPVDLNSATAEMRIPRVFLNVNNPTPDECHLVVYRTSGITVCLFAPALMDLAREFFLTLDTLIGLRLAALSADLVEQAILRKTTNLNIGSDSMRFMYFNQWNMAFKSTLHQSSPGHRRVLQCQPALNNEIIKTCADLSDDLAVFGEGEAVIRTKNDAWVLGKLSNQRHLYVVVTRKNAELTEICDEVRRLRNVLFKDILLVE